MITSKQVHTKHIDRTKLKGRLSQHIWSVIQHTPKIIDGEAMRVQLLCNGKPFPASGPNHTIDFYVPSYRSRPVDQPQKVKAVYTSFNPDMTMTLCDMVPVEEPEKRLSARQWWDAQKPGTKQWLRDRMNDQDYPAWIETYYQASAYLHGWRDSLAFLID